MPIKIVVADDHSMFREMLLHILTYRGDKCVVMAEAADLSGRGADGGWRQRMAGSGDDRPDLARVDAPHARVAELARRFGSRRAHRIER